MKKIMMAVMIATMTLGMSMVSMAANWQWLDTDNDGIAECYCFDDDGNLIIQTTFEDGTMVNDKGQWITNPGGIQRISLTSNGVKTEDVAGTYYVTFEWQSANGRQRSYSVEDGNFIDIIATDENVLTFVQKHYSDRLYQRNSDGNFINYGMNCIVNTLYFEDDGTMIHYCYNGFDDAHTVTILSKLN